MKKLLFVSMIVACLYLVSVSAQPAYNGSNVIYQCGDVDLPGNYILNQSLYAEDTCLLISAGNVTIDGDGFNISGDTDSSEDGIYAFDVANISLINLTSIFGFNEAGIYLYDINDSYISNTGLDKNGIGLIADTSFFNNFEGLTAFTNTGANGIELLNSYNNSFFNLSIFNNSIIGIDLESSSYNSFFNSSIYNQDASIYSFTWDSCIGNFVYNPHQTIALNSTVSRDINPLGNFYSGGYVDDCGTLVLPGVYTLNKSLSTNGSCLMIGSDNIIVTGNGFNILGDIFASESDDNGRSYTNLTVENVNITGNIDAYGIDPAGVMGAGSYGGSVTIINSTLEEINANAGPGSAGVAGNVTLVSSNVQEIYSRGSWSGMAGGGGGVSGFVIVQNGSYVGSIDSSGAWGRNGGAVNISDSYVNLTYAHGGVAANGGPVFVENSSINILNSSAGNHFIPMSSSCRGGTGGAVSISNSNVFVVDIRGDGSGTGGSVSIVNSTVFFVDSSGGMPISDDCDGGVGGTVTITNSNVTSVNTSGQTSVLAGGSGGAVSISNNFLNLTDSNIDVSSGVSSNNSINGTAGVIILNYTAGFSDVDATYGQTIKLKIVRSDQGSIDWSNSQVSNADLDGNLSEGVVIGNKFVFVNSTILPELNTSAVVSIFNLDYGYPTIYKNGKNCSGCSSVVYNQSTGVLAFNVSSFSNYSIGGLGITINSPTENSIVNANSVTLNFTVDWSQVNLSKCSLFVNGNLFNEQSWDSSTIVPGIPSIADISSDAVYGNNQVNVSCFYSDSTNRSYSVTSNFSVTVAPEVQTNSRSDGGGSGSEIINLDLYKMPNLDLANGTLINFILGSQTHSLTILNVLNNSALLEVQSDPQQFSLNVGDSKVVNLENVSLNVTLNNIINNIAYIGLAETTFQNTSLSQDSEITTKMNAANTNQSSLSGVSSPKHVVNFELIIGYLVLCILILVIIYFLVGRKDIRNLKLS